MNNYLNQLISICHTFLLNLVFSICSPKQYHFHWVIFIVLRQSIQCLIHHLRTAIFRGLSEMLWQFQLSILNKIFLSISKEQMRVKLAETFRLPRKSYNSFKVLFPYLFLHYKAGLNATTANNAVRFVRPVHPYSRLVSKFLGSNADYIEINILLRFIDGVMIMLMITIIWSYWSNYFIFVGLTLQLLYYMLTGYPINELNFSTLSDFHHDFYQQQLSSNGLHSVDYYNLKYIDTAFIDLFSNNFTQISPVFLPYVWNHIFIFYLLQFLFFVFSYIQLRNILLLHGQMSLETSFQIPLFFKWSTFFNLNPYEDAYYQVFVSHVKIQKIPLYSLNSKKKKVFNLAAKLKKDLFDHPRYLLKHEQGQLALIKYISQVQILVFVCSIGILFLFYFLPLFTCLFLWVLMLFSQWFVFRNTVYTDSYYLDQIRPQLKMINFQQIENSYTTITTIRPILQNFYTNSIQVYVMKFLFYFKRINFFLFFSHITDELFWSVYLQARLALFIEQYPRLYDFFCWFVRLCNKLLVILDQFTSWFFDVIVLSLILVLKIILYILQNYFFTAKRLRRRIGIYIKHVTREVFERGWFKLKTMLYWLLTNLITYYGRQQIKEKIKESIKTFCLSVTVIFLKCVHIFYNRLFILYTKKDKALEKECTLYRKNGTKSKQACWTWHYDIVEHINGTFYKITKIDNDKVYGAEIKFLDLNEEKTYYYGKKIFLCNVENFLNTFPLLDPALFLRIVQFEEQEVDLIRFIIFCTNFYNFLIDAEKEVDETLFALSLQSDYLEIQPTLDFLGKKTYKKWKLKKEAKFLWEEETLEEPYDYWVEEEEDGSFADIGFNDEFTDLYGFNKYSADEMSFVRWSRKDIEDEEKHEDDDQFRHSSDVESAYIEMDELFVEWEEYSDTTDLPDADYIFMTQVEQTLDYWMRLNIILIVHFFSCLLFFFLFIIYCMYSNPQELFFFLFDFSNYFLLDVYYWWITHQFIPTWANKTIFVYNYVKIVAVQSDNLFATYPTNLYGFCLAQVSERLLEFHNRKRIEVFDDGVSYFHSDYQYLDFKKKKIGGSLDTFKITKKKKIYQSWGHREKQKILKNYIELRREFLMYKDDFAKRKKTKLTSRFFFLWDIYRFNFHFYYFNIINIFLLLQQLFNETLIIFWLGVWRIALFFPISYFLLFFLLSFKFYYRRV
jgi:hypothetical protein